MPAHIDKIGHVEELLEATVDEARDLARDLGKAGRLVWSSDAGHKVVVTEEGAQVLGRLLEALVDGHEVVVVHGDKTLTPNDAAEILGVSRPTVMKWVRQGKLAAQPVNSHSRLLLRDVLQLQSQRDALATQARDAAERARKIDRRVKSPSAEEVASAAHLARAKGDEDALEQARAARLVRRAEAAAARARPR